MQYSAFCIPKLNMTQVIVCSTHEGIVLATDSCATWFDQTGGMRHFNLKKLLRLSSHSAIVSAGEGIGVEISIAFQEFLQRQRQEDIDQIARSALPFFTEHYGMWLNRREKDPLPSRTGSEEIEEETPFLPGVYLILAGYSFRDRARPYHLYLFASGVDRTSIKIHPASQIIVIPRSLSMERRLEAQCEEGSSLDHLLSMCKSFLRRRSDEEEEVGPPFFFATITPIGYKEVIEEEVNE